VRGCLLLAGSLAVATILSACEPAPDPHPSPSASAPEWVRLPGGPGTDAAFGAVATAGGTLYIAGVTEGALDGPNRGEADAFLSAYAADGRQLMLHQFGTAGRDSAFGIAGGSSGVYVAGITFGALGGTFGGAYDAFVVAFSLDGTERWKAQIGTAEREYASSVAVDAQANVYITGDTFGDLGGPNAGAADAYVTRLGPDGRRMWTQQLGGPGGEVAKGIAVGPSGTVLIAGQTDDDLGAGFAGQSDAFLVAYDRDGKRLWTQQLGTSAVDYANAVATDANGNVFVTGITEGDLLTPNAGGVDVFVAAYDPGGNRLWAHQLGTPTDEQANAIAVGADGGPCIAGSGAADAFVTCYDATGHPRWTQRWSGPGIDLARGVACAGDAVWIAGQTAAGDDHGVDTLVAKYRR